MARLKVYNGTTSAWEYVSTGTVGTENINDEAVTLLKMATGAMKFLGTSLGSTAAAQNSILNVATSTWTDIPTQAAADWTLTVTKELGSTDSDIYIVWGCSLWNSNGVNYSIYTAPKFAGTLDQNGEVYHSYLFDNPTAGGGQYLKTGIAAGSLACKIQFVHIRGSNGTIIIANRFMTVYEVRK